MSDAHDFAEARIARPLHHFEHGWGHVFLALDQHVPNLEA